MQINYFWKGLPPKIDAVYENSEGKFVFFKGNKTRRIVCFQIVSFSFLNLLKVRCGVFDH